MKLMATVILNRDEAFGYSHCYLQLYGRIKGL